MMNPRVKTVSSTSSITFRNTSGSYYDMIISVQNQTIDQSISITDTEGNLVTENPIVLSVPAKVILKDVKVGEITFSDSNVYNVIISYVVKETATGIPYVDIDYQNGYTYTQETGSPIYTNELFPGENFYHVSPPTGKKWILRSLKLYWTAAATLTDTIQVQIAPTDTTTDQTSNLNVYYGTLAVTEGDIYSFDLAKYIQNMASTLIAGVYVSQITVPNGFEVYDTEMLKVGIVSETADVTLYMSYIEVNLG